MFFSKPLYFFSILTGICVFKPKGKFSVFLALWAAACLTAASFVSIPYRIRVARMHSYDFRFDIFSHALPTLSLFGKVLTCIIHLVVSVVMRRDFEDVFRLLTYQRTSVLHLVVFVLGFAMSSSIYVMHLIRIYKWPPYMDDYRWPHTVDSASLLYFSTLCYYINLQFCCLVQSGRRKVGKLIERLSKGDLFSEHQHLKITQSLRTANALYGIQTTLNCAQSFSYLLTHIYYLSTYEKFEPFPEPSYKLALKFHAVYSAIILFKLVFSCETAASEVNAFNNELVKVLQVNEDIRRCARLKLYVMVDPSVEFSACGFFSLSYPLLTSVITATVSYVIVLVQFT